MPNAARKEAIEDEACHIASRDAQGRTLKAVLVGRRSSLPAGKGRFSVCVAQTASTAADAMEALDSSGARVVLIDGAVDPDALAMAGRVAAHGAPVVLFNMPSVDALSDAIAHGVAGYLLVDADAASLARAAAEASCDVVGARSSRRRLTHLGSPPSAA